MENVPAATGPNTSVSRVSQSGEGNTEVSRSNSPEVEQDTLDAKKPHPIVAGFSKLTLSRQAGLMIGLAASIALGLFVVLWSQSESYSPLMNANNSFDAKDVINVLQEAKIDFNIDPASGVILVKDSDLHDARLAIAGAGLSNDDTVGFELLDQEQALGTSQFMENTRYRRGLEGELARTIASINQIRTARVHLAMPKRSVFVKDKRESTASVFVELYSGATLEKEHVKAITNLVATSVEEMQPESVTIVDQRGRLLSDFDEDPQATQNDKQFEFTRKVEDSMTRRINSILEPIIGSDAFRAEVSADVDFTKVEQAEELFNPDLIALRSEQVLSEEKVGEANGGIPGALTNQPPGNAIAPEETGNGAGGTAPPTTKRDEATRNYEVDRTLSYTEYQQGRLRRVTVAVVVDDLKTVNADGESVRQAWSQEELDRLRILVQDAVGFDPSRGDSINVINSPFMAEQDVIEEPAFWTQSWFWDFARQVLAGLFVLVLIFGVFRPALKSLMNKVEDEDELQDTLDTLDIDEDAISDDKVTLSGADEFMLPGANSESFDRQLDAIRGLLAEDPGRVALVFKSWILSND